MNTANSSRITGRRPTDLGAVLVVVLIVTIALLGLGMTGLFLTSGGMQINTNINLRNQALVVAEAGIERARAVLNDRNAVPSIPALLAGSTSGGDEVPTSLDPVYGLPVGRGAIMVDRITTGCTSGTTPTGCTLQNVPYPSPSSFDRLSDLPPSAGTLARPTMGEYTVYIRQDLADCRMGNFVCDEAPVSAAPDGGAAVGGPFACDPPPVPAPNHTVVVRSEGVASDGKTRVVLEVTMTPSLGTQQGFNTPMAALDHPNDPPGFQNGIVVDSPISQQPPTGAGGAQSTGGAPGTGGVVGTGGSVPPSSGVGGATTGTGGATTGTGGHGTGGSGTGGSTGCAGWTCPALATMGVYGLHTATNFASWLDKQSSGCAVKDLHIEDHQINDNPGDPYRLSQYNLILVLDVGHTKKNYTDYWAKEGTDHYGAWQIFSDPKPPDTNTIRRFSAQEAQVLKTWVQNGGGLLMTQGYDDSLATMVNANALLQPLGLTFSSPACGLDVNCTKPNNPPNLKESIIFQTAYIFGSFDVTTFASHPVTSGMTHLYLQGYWPIEGYPLDSARQYTKTPLGSNYAVLATHDYTNRNGVHYWPLNVMVAGSLGSGRVVVIADEWLTFDDTWPGGTYGTKFGTSTAKFWPQVISWLKGSQCN